MAARGGGPALVGNFLQMVELHYRDGWPVARYADALGVTSDKLHAHCQREKNCGPRAIIHANADVDDGEAEKDQRHREPLFSHRLS